MRVRAREGDFFSSCKPFQLCNCTREKYNREKRKEKKELSVAAIRFIERRGARFAWHFVSCCTLGSGRERGLQGNCETEGGMSRGCLLL